MREEIRANNQVFNLAKGTSFLVFSYVGVSLFFLALLLEFTLNALYYSLDPKDDEAPLFWAVVIENFWVAVYSLILSLIPLFLIVLSFTPSSKMKKQLQEAKSVKQSNGLTKACRED